MNAATEAGPLHPFAFVGCWNLEAPEKAREAVAAAIAASDAGTVILGGDNIYAPASKNAYNRKAFHDGAKLYTEMKKRLLVAVGNHNIDFATFNILGEEREAFGPHAMPPHATYFSRKFADGYSVVVIDTNLGQEIKGETPKMKEYREEQFRDMLQWLRSVSVGNYYLVQHEPVISFKKFKKGAKKYHLLERAQEILDALTVPPVAILCADTHNYQVGHITTPRMSILQYVVGTGGAEPDTLDPLDAWGNTYTPEGTSITYTFEGHTPGYGYLYMPPPAPFVFVQGWKQGGGTRRRRASRPRHTKSRHRVRG